MLLKLFCRTSECNHIRPQPVWILIFWPLRKHWISKQRHARWFLGALYVLETIPNHFTILFYTGVFGIFESSGRFVPKIVSYHKFLDVSYTLRKIWGFRTHSIKSFLDVSNPLFFPMTLQVNVFLTFFSMTLQMNVSVGCLSPTQWSLRMFCTHLIFQWLCR